MFQIAEAGFVMLRAWRMHAQDGGVLAGEGSKANESEGVGQIGIQGPMNDTSDRMPAKIGQ